jgi:hypothetical protein
MRLLAERERRARKHRRADRQQVAALIAQAQRGNWRPLFACQWPGIRLDSFQEDILDALFDPTLWGIFVKGNTGCGKSAVGGMGVALYYAVWPESKVVITSATYDHAKGILFAETASWFKRMQFPPEGFVGSQRIGDETHHYVEVVNPLTDEAFSGRHGPHVLFCFDEATAIADSRFKIARTQATKFLAFSNPRSMFGFFRQAFPSDAPNDNQTCLTPHGKCRFQTIDGETILNVRERRLERPLAPPGGIQIGPTFYSPGMTIPPADYDLVRPLIPGQVCYDTFLSLKAETDPRWVNVFCHGRFPDEDPERQLILQQWVERSGTRWSRFHRLHERVRREGRVAAMRRLRNWFPVQAFGLDVAASDGGDETILSAGGRKGIRQLHACRERDTMAIVGWVLRTALEDYGIDLRQGQHPVATDMDGLGKGVGDRLREQNVRIIDIHGNDTADDPKLYVNRRAERYALLGQRLDPRGQYADDLFLLPNDPLLAQELRAVEKIYSGSDALRFGVIPKRRPAGSNYDGPTIHGKIGRSPDRADSVTYCFEAIRTTAGSSLEDWLNAGAF